MILAPFRKRRFMELVPLFRKSSITSKWSDNELFVQCYLEAVAVDFFPARAVVLTALATSMQFHLRARAARHCAEEKVQEGVDGAAQRPLVQDAQ